METINFGIDLGTTNSGIGQFNNGKVKLLKNPVGFQEILPSVVAWKKERILVGDKAREQLLVNPEFVYSSFKRKMGTNETFTIPEINKTVDPIELSSLVLKELKNFAIDEKVDAAVITIPASFDTIQSNATKEAGIKAGIQEVVLLQEPIAACLTYANENNIDLTVSKKWLVYDFGGGTFDAALVDVNERELKVIDHKGNNFLGGVDLDFKMLTSLIIPHIEQQNKLNEIWKKINEGTDLSYVKLGKYLLYKAETAKKELSLSNDTWIELDFPELAISQEINLTRTAFNQVVKPYYDESLELINQLLNSNFISFNQIDKIILVGGTTYIPYIREQLANDTGISVDTSIDPTTAVIIGAAYFAGTKLKTTQKKQENNSSTAPQNQNDIAFKITYENLTKDLEELITIQAVTAFGGFMRITRQDGGFDTGMIEFMNKRGEFVSLLPKQQNNFTLQVYNRQQELVYTKNDISISQGVYNISGQPLPNDICIELDSDKETYLELLFKKNDILPLKKTIYKTFSKSVPKNSDQKILINIVEGKAGTMPGANLNIGFIEVSGKELQEDLIKGTDVEINFTISESRDLTITVYIPNSGQEIRKNFNPSYHNLLSNDKMIEEIERGLFQLENTIREKEAAEDYMALAKLVKIQRELNEIRNQLENSKGDTVTDSKYQLAEKKRQLLFEIDQSNILDDVVAAIDNYKETRDYLLRNEEKFTPTIKRDFDVIVKDEINFLKSNDRYLIQRKTEALDKLANVIFFENDDSYYIVFMNLKFMEAEKYTDYKKAQKLFAEGDKAAEKNDTKQLRSVCMLLFGLLKESAKQNQDFSGTGLK